jgi:hypothetical protein
LYQEGAKGEREAIGVEAALEMGREKAKGIVEG